MSIPVDRNQFAFWLSWIIITFGIGSAFAFWFYAPSLDQRTQLNALRFLGSIISILTGFLIASVVLMSNPGLLYRGSWRTASRHGRQLKRQIRRLTLLLNVYMISLLMIFVALIWVDSVTQEFKENFVRVTLCVGLTALIWSFCLPILIRRVQFDGIDEVVDRRREEGRTASSAEPKIDERSSTLSR